MNYEYETLAVELLRELRGKRSRAQFSKRLGYRSNVAHRWELGASWPTAASYFQHHRSLHPGCGEYFQRFLLRAPSWLEQCEPESPQAIAAFLREIRGKTPISTIAQSSGFNRYQVSRWLSGAAQPRLPEFLCLVEVSSRRLLDLLAVVVDPGRLPSAARSWAQLAEARKAAYEQPWSHAVLRALEIEMDCSGARQQIHGLAERLGVDVGIIEPCMRTLQATGQVKKRRGKFFSEHSTAVNTAQDPELARALKLSWTRTATERMQGHSPGSYGYSLFAVSRADLRRLRDLHLEYVRAMQDLIAKSQPSECVGLYCSQLLDLGRENNALLVPPNAPGSLARKTMKARRAATVG